MPKILYVSSGVGILRLNLTDTTFGTKSSIVYARKIKYKGGRITK